MFKYIPSIAFKYEPCVCLSHICGCWSNPFYCMSVKHKCFLTGYYKFLLLHGLPSGQKQLKLF